MSNTTPVVVTVCPVMGERDPVPWICMIVNALAACAIGTLMTAEKAITSASKEVVVLICAVSY